MTNCTRDVGASPLLYLRVVANLPRFFCSKVEVIVVQVRIPTGGEFSIATCQQYQLRESMIRG
jgi:hypothetical protein